MLIFLISAPELAQQQHSPAALDHATGESGKRRTGKPLVFQVYHILPLFRKNLYLQIAFSPKSHKHISVKAKSPMCHIFGLPSLPTLSMTSQLSLQAWLEMQFHTVKNPVAFLKVGTQTK